MQKNKINKIADKKLHQLKPRAFSLIELSIVIVIIAILVSGALTVSVASINKAKIDVTNKRIEEIYKAMGNYLAVNKTIPCPAAMINTKTSASYGLEIDCKSSLATTGVWQSATNDNIVYGMLPTQSLGLSSDMAEDGFGSRFGYIMLKGYNTSSKLALNTDSKTFDGAGGDGVGVTNRIRINEKPSATSLAVTTQAAFVIISYGANKSGAFSSTSTAQNTASSDSDEATNYPTSINTAAGTATLGFPWLKNSGNSDVFDDILFYKSRDQALMDFNLMSLAQCSALTAYSIYGGSFDFPAAGYEESAVSTTNCSTVSYNKGPAKPARKCGAFGVWDVMTNPCLQ